MDKRMKQKMPGVAPTAKMTGTAAKMTGTAAKVTGTAAKVTGTAAKVTGTAAKVTGSTAIAKPAPVKVAFYAPGVVESPALPYLSPPNPDEEERWYTPLDTFLAKEAGASRKIPSAQLEEMCAAVELVYKKEIEHYAEGKKSKKKSSDDKWFDDVIKSGTLSDKVAALALLVQESPPHHLNILDQLVDIATKKEQRPAQLALEALKDLLLHNLLPDRRLHRFRSGPLGSEHMSMKTALLMWYEEELLLRVESTVSALEAGVKSNVEFFKKACMEVAAEWLAAKPEQESRLLSLLVHKLGDPSNGVCNKAMELLKGIVRSHPSMKCVVVREVRQLIYFESTPPRSLYNGVLFLSSLTLTENDHEVALQLIDAYMGLFESVADKKEMKSRLLSVLLTGVNRAFPFVKTVEPLQKHIDSLFRIAHTASFSASTQALTLILYLAIGNADSSSPEDPAKASLLARYYRALYSKLLSDEFTSRTRNTMFLNLLYRSMKRDPSDLRCMAFTKRIFMSALQSAGAIAAGLLFLVSEVISHRPALVDMMTKIEETEGEGATGADMDDANNDNGNGDDNDDDGRETHQLGSFDASKREPLFTCSTRPSLWELSLLRCHFHPSVRAFSESLAAEGDHKIVYNGNPIAELSISAFLNRFAYKNPKKMDEKKSIKASSAKKEEPLNSLAFINTNALNVDADKKFFYKFFSDRDRLRTEGKSRDRSKKSRGGGYEGDAIEGDDDGEDMDSDGEERQQEEVSLEDEIDKFADKLAMDLMKSYANGAGPDIDDDFSDDDDEDDEMESIGDEGDEVQDDGDDDDDDEDDDDSEAEGEDSGEEGAGGYRLKEYGDDDQAGDRDDDDDDDDDGEDVDEDDNDDNDDDDDVDVFSLMSRGGAQHGSKKRDRGGDSDFADASAYEALMEENIQKFSKKKK